MPIRPFLKDYHSFEPDDIREDALQARFSCVGQRFSCLTVRKTEMPTDRALIAGAPLDHGRNPRADIAFDCRSNDGSGELKGAPSLAPAAAPNRAQRDNLRTGQCTVPEPPVTLRVRRAVVACHRDNDAKLVRSVSPKVVNTT
jgi:hypothetical protein